jgi:hypothetical protein
MVWINFGFQIHLLETHQQEIILHTPVYFPMSELPSKTAAGASKAEYQEFMKGMIPIFNILNPENAAENVVDADLPCAADAGPTNAEIKTGFDDVVDKINATTDSSSHHMPAR